MELAQIEERLELFGDMLLCCHRLYLWQYDSGFYLIRSNCPHQAAVNNLFGLLHSGRMAESLAHQQDTPLLLTNSIGMMWVTQPG